MTSTADSRKLISDDARMYSFVEHSRPFFSDLAPAVLLPADLRRHDRRRRRTACAWVAGWRADVLLDRDLTAGIVCLTQYFQLFISLTAVSPFSYFKDRGRENRNDCSRGMPNPRARTKRMSDGTASNESCSSATDGTEGSSHASRAHYSGLRDVEAIAAGGLGRRHGSHGGERDQRGGVSLCIV